MLKRKEDIDDEKGKNMINISHVFSMMREKDIQMIK